MPLTGPAQLAEAARRVLAILAPPPELTISDWADANRRLSSEASAEPGQWRTERAEYQRGIVDAISDPRVESVVIMSSAQVGKTEVINCAIGYARAAGEAVTSTITRRARRPRARSGG